MRHFLSINDITREEAAFLLAEATRLKLELKEHPARQRESLLGKNLALVFEKPSLRTRVSFDVGMNQLGGHALYLSPAEIGLGTRESIADVSRVLSRMCDGIMARVFKNETVHELAKWSSVPVINGLCDSEHPCQAMADLLTLKENKGLEGRKIAYLGDGNNVCHSLMVLCAKLGVHCSVAAPEGYEPQDSFVAIARAEAEHTGAIIEVLREPREAVHNADALYTDVWTSMGQEEESRQRAEIFPPYQLNSELLHYAKPDAIVLHDLPAHKGEEITEDVFEAHANTIFSQAENRLHAQKAIVAWLLG